MKFMEKQFTANLTSRLCTLDDLVALATLDLDLKIAVTQRTEKKIIRMSGINCLFTLSK